MDSHRTYLQLFNHGGAFHLDLGNGASIWRWLLQNKMKHENGHSRWEVVEEGGKKVGGKKRKHN